MYGYPLGIFSFFPFVVNRIIILWKFLKIG